MAVVQISRIQIRRGQANSGTGLPQLASGELAWAIDTQQLFIGNGSVAEGAPAVGNTKILTQNDLSAQGNLLALLQYVYKTSDTTIQTGANVNTPISRSLQQRLDNYVTSVEFGTLGVGGGGDGLALQRAIDELFLNSNGKASADTISGTQQRIALNIPAGVYITNKPLYIPSYATLSGAGADKTIIQYNPTSTVVGSTINNSTTLTTTGAIDIMLGASVSGTNIPANTTVVSVNAGVSLELSNGATGTGTDISFSVTLGLPAVQFINDTSTIGSPSSIGSTLGVNQPRNIIMTGMTIESTSGTNVCLQLDAVRDSVFDNLNLKGNWNVPDTPSTNCVGIFLQAFSDLVTSEHNLFRNISFEGFTNSVVAKQDINNNSFEDCLIKEAQKGFLLGLDADGVSTGQKYGPRETLIRNIKFVNVKEHGVYVDLGYGNNVRDCKFENVGSDGAGIQGVTYPEVYFNQYGNTAENNYSDRTANLASNNYLSVKYVPEVAGHGVYNSYGTRTTDTIEYVSDPAFLFRLPCPTNEFGAATGTIGYEISYHYTSSLVSRRGTITLVVDASHKKIQLTDEYDFAGNDANSLALEFSARFLDEAGGAWVSPEVPGSVAIYYSNSLNGDLGTFVYSYKAVF